LATNDRSEPRRSAASDQKGTSELDAYVGQRLRLRRTMVGMKQEELAEAVGVSYQQIQKYERGETRLTIGRLIDIGIMLGVPVNWFLDGLNAAKIPTLDDGLERDLQDFMRLFISVENSAVRRRFLQLARVLAEPDVPEQAEVPSSRLRRTRLG
jgi:transcriptional regulator with XRE-family HTH domain